MNVARLPHGSVGGGAPLFPPLPLPLPYLPRPRLVEVGGLTSTDAVEPDVASTGGPCCDGRGWGCLDSRWRFVEADKMPGCGAVASRPAPMRALPLRGRGTTLRGLPFLLFLPAVRPRLLPPFVTSAPLRAASNCLDAISNTGRKRLPEPPELAGAREGACAGVVMEVPESVDAA